MTSGQDEVNALIKLNAILQKQNKLLLRYLISKKQGIVAYLTDNHH